jgi:hypothetical protein
MVFHGLRELLGENCVDYNHAWLMYTEDMERYWTTRVPEHGKSYGGGFTLYGTLPNISVDRTDILKKLQTKYFDKIVYGSVHRNLELIVEVLQHYDRKDIIFIDGEDQTHLRLDILDKGVYFKRELVYTPTKLIRPLNFAIPEKLIVNSVPSKSKDWGTIIPGDKSTYVFDNQQDYYDDYASSYFALTTKKGGWDCLRHYEILMNGCIPYFPDLSGCPEYTMTRFPKSYILDTNKFVDTAEFSTDMYGETVNQLLEHTRTHLSTLSLAKYILEE